MNNIRRLFKQPADSFFLLGPRGTGKSLWCRKEMADAVYIDLLDEATFRIYASHPERLLEVQAGTARKTFIIDEVQKVPTILNAVHLLIEKDKTLQFALTGSSPRKLRQGGMNLLGGRALNKRMHPFMAAELGKAFSIEKGLNWGMLPLVWGAVSPIEKRNAYAGLYLREEIQMEGLTRHIGDFSRFLESISFSHGSTLNLASIARDCAVERKRVESYVSILEDLLLGHRLSVFTKRAQRLLSHQEKFYFFDTGIFRSIRPTGPLDSVSEIEGAALEGLIFQHLHAWCDYTDVPNKVYFWQTRAQLEVDFVIYGESGLWAFEVKSTQKVRPEDQRGLKAFAHDYPMAQLAILYRGHEILKQGNILYLPCEHFLQNLTPNQPLWRV
ncbi:MAG: ATPase [Verrucomicrobia bacterium GWF2_51_19]|nr:MAG: ATPase [Verrucomicrobia bacterium GWF2_51_19]HAD82596.1 ATPase [Candidatus Edwardsbacteria bacterium]